MTSSVAPTGDRPMSVLQLVASPRRRGAEVFALELERELRARGQQVVTEAMRRADTDDPLPVRALGDRAFAPATLRALRTAARSADVVVAHGSVTLPASVIALVASTVPVVYRNIGDPEFWSSTRLRRWRTSLLLHEVDHVVALSAGAARTLRHGFRVPSTRITVIPNGASPNRFRPVGPAGRATARLDLGIHDDRPLVVSIGALDTEKDVGTTIDGVERVGGAELLVVGDGPERPALERHAGPNVRFLGVVRDPRPVYAAADVLVSTSRSEGLPGVLIEAGLSGVPVVATDVGYVRDIVEDGVTGRLVAPGDDAAVTVAVENVLRDRAGLGAAARARCVQHFGLDAVADAWNTLLVDVARGCLRTRSLTRGRPRTTGRAS